MRPDAELFTADLTRAEVLALASDLVALARISSVRTKGGATSNSAAAEIDAATALEALADGHCLAVQLEYVHDSVGYRDTVMARTSGGWRLVRCRYG